MIDRKIDPRTIDQLLERDDPKNHSLSTQKARGARDTAEEPDRCQTRMNGEARISTSSPSLPQTSQCERDPRSHYYYCGTSRPSDYICSTLTYQVFIFSQSGPNAYFPLSHTTTLVGSAGLGMLNRTHKGPASSETTRLPTPNSGFSSTILGLHREAIQFLVYTWDLLL